MLQRTGDFNEWELAEKARDYIDLYKKGEVCYVPYKDLPSGKKRFVKYEWLASQWVFVDLVDLNV